MHGLGLGWEGNIMDGYYFSGMGGIGWWGSCVYRRRRNEVMDMHLSTLPCVIQLDNWILVQ